MAICEGDISPAEAKIVAEQDVGIYAVSDLNICSGQIGLGNFTV